MGIMKKAKIKHYKTACINKEKISSVRKKMRSDRTMQEIAKMFEVIGGHTKVDIISALCFYGMCASASSEKGTVLFFLIFVKNRTVPFLLRDMESLFIDPLVAARLVIDKILNPI